MKKLFSLLAFSLTAFGSNSLIVNPTIAGRGTMSGTPWATLTDYVIEFTATGYSVAVGNAVGLWEQDSFAKLFLDNANGVNMTGAHGENLTFSNVVSLNNCPSAFRVRAQRNTGAAKYYIEVWCESTGAYQSTSATDTNTAAVNRNGLSFSIGSFLEPTQLTANIGAIRIFSTNVTFGNPLNPPRRLLTSSFGDLLDYEFETNMTDSSPLAQTFTFSSGSASYVTTPVTVPGVNQTSTGILVAAVGVGLVIGGITEFANNDNPALANTWSQLSGPSGSFSSTSILAPSFMPSAFGTANLQLIVTDVSSNSITVGPIKFGGVPLLPNTTNVDIKTAAGGGATGQQIKDMLVGVMMYGTNPLGYFENRALTASNQQILNKPTFYPAWWKTVSTHGVLTVVNDPVLGFTATCVGASCQLQIDLCGGGTTPVSPGHTGLSVNYPSTIYAGQTAYAHFYVGGCPSPTSVTLTQQWNRLPGTTPSLPYSIDPTGIQDTWAQSNIPANYYDNVLAFYYEYYSTGIDTFRDAARLLADDFFNGPLWENGNVFSTGNGAWAIEGRSVSSMGLVLWGLESGTNVWPGLEVMWASKGSFIAGNIAAGAIGDFRESAYISTLEGNCVLYDPSPPASCATDIANATNNWWAPLGGAHNPPLEVTGALASPPAVNNTWASNEPSTVYAGSFKHDGSNCSPSPCHVVVTNGSKIVTLVGGDTWDCSATGTFFNPEYPFPNLHQFLWFYNDPTLGTVPGNSNSGDANHAAPADGTTYTLAEAGGSCDSPTQITLPVNYGGTSGNKGLQVSFYSGFGVSGFMGGIASGVFGDWNYRAFQKLGDTASANNAKKVSVDLMAYIQSTLMDNSIQQLYFGRTFLNCEGYVNNRAPAGGWTPAMDPACVPGITTNGEIMHACVAAYPLNPSPALLTFCDKTLVAMFCKPGFPCMGYSQINGTYDTNFDDWPGGVNITTGPNGASSAATNKWFGYAWGIGYSHAWFVVRQPAVSNVSSSIMSGKQTISGKTVVH